MALVTLQDVKDYYGYPDSDDALVQDLIDRASAMIESYTKRKFESASYTEFLDGGGVDLIVKERPIQSVASIRDFADPNNPITVDADDYTVYESRGYIRYSTQGYGNGILADYSTRDTLPVAERVWTFGAKRWEVQYTGGYTEIPLDIQQATIWLVGSLKEQIETGGTYASESLGDYSYTLADSLKTTGMPANVMQVLNNYREVIF